jgi:hypothetical protein
MSSTNDACLIADLWPFYRPKATNVGIKTKNIMLNKKNLRPDHVQKSEAIKHQIITTLIFDKNQT